MLEDRVIVKDNLTISNIFNEYFNTITRSLNIPSVPNSKLTNSDTLHNTLKSFPSHPSIRLIREKSTLSANKFEFFEFTVDDVREEILKLAVGNYVYALTKLL